MDVRLLTRDPLNFQRQVLIGTSHVFQTALVYKTTLFFEVNKEKQLNLLTDRLACSLLGACSVACPFTRS